MSTIPTPAPTLTGQDIAVAARATRALLDALLAESGTPFTSWVAVNFAAAGGASAREDHIVGRLVNGLKVDSAEATAAVDEAVVAGLVRRRPDAGGTVVELTPDGRAVHGPVSAGIARITERLYGDLPPDDLATTRRVLNLVTERANAVLAGG